MTAVQSRLPQIRHSSWCMGALLLTPTASFYCRVTLMKKLTVKLKLKLQVKSQHCRLSTPPPLCPHKATTSTLDRPHHHRLQLLRRRGGSLKQAGGSFDKASIKKQQMLQRPRSRQKLSIGAFSVGCFFQMQSDCLTTRGSLIPCAQCVGKLSPAS